MATNDEAEKVKKGLEGLIKDLDALERKWFRLPEKVREANPGLAKWFAKAPRVKAKGQA